MPKLSLPPLNSLAKDAQAAFRAIAAWANSVDQSPQKTVEQKTVYVNQQASSVSEKESTRIAEQVATRVVSRRTGDIMRDVLQNSGTQPAIEMNAPVLFKASSTVGSRTHAVFIGAGGLIGAHIDEGSPMVTTFSLSAADGSFSFGAEDPAYTSDPSHKQIVFDATNNVITFGADIVIQRSSGATITLDDLADSAAGYTTADLQNDLTAGVGNVLAGVGGDYRLEASADNGWILLKHKDVLYGHTGGGAGYTGNFRTAVGITANGVMAGYNDKTTGDWVNSIALDATTGVASFSGAVNALSGNFAESITVGGTTLNAIRLGAASGATAVQPGAIAGMLTASSSYVLGGVVSMPSASSSGMKTGTITWDSAGIVNGGSGVAITNKGIVGASAGVVTFSINGTTGSAIFKGDISGATGSFAGNIDTTSGSVTARGVSSVTGSTASIVGYNTLYDGNGVVGYIGPSIPGSPGSAGVSGSAERAGDFGVRGSGPSSGSGAGVYGIGSSVNCHGVRARNVYGGYALYVEGKAYISDNTGLNADLLDGNHASAFLLASETAADSSELGGYTPAYYARYVSIASGSPGTAFTHSITVAINGINVRIPIFYP